MLKYIAVCAAFIVGTSGMAAAQTNIALGGVSVDPTSAVEVTAESLSVDQDSGVAIFTGNVIIVQAEMRVTASRVEVIYGSDTSQIERLIATGGVTLVTPEEAAEAQEADYDVSTGFVDLTGDVLLTQGGSAIAAEKMRINVADGTATMDGRVRTVLQQGDN
jgi:lipopolysaccharide export system protein LptA